MRTPTRWPIPTTRPIVRTWQDVLDNITSGNEQLVDARPPEQYNGDTSFRYPGVRPGHIPGSINLSQRNLRNADNVFFGTEDMRAIFADHGIDLTRPIIATCGSGITACIIALACEVIGQGRVAVYDGSWEEWGGRFDLPAELD
jgi:thiosulfate/3-mercaptopyruvate sulfurtransferase